MWSSLECLCVCASMNEVNILKICQYMHVEKEREFVCVCVCVCVCDRERTQI